MGNDFFDFFLPLIFFVVVIIGGGSALLIGVDYLDCRGFAETGYEVKWNWGCYAKVDGKWLPKKYVFGEANEIRLKKEGK